MSKQRARQRAEREAAAAAAREERRRARERRERRSARVRSVREAVPRPPRWGHGRPRGRLAARHRRRVLLLTGLWVLLQVVAWLLVDSWAGRGVVAVLTAFAMPVVWTLVYDRS